MASTQYAHLADARPRYKPALTVDCTGINDDGATGATGSLALAHLLAKMVASLGRGLSGHIAEHHIGVGDGALVVLDRKSVV